MEKENKLKLMKFWIFGVFVIIVAGATIYIGSVVGAGTAIFLEMRYWIAIIASALLCVICYYGYKNYLDRKE